MSFLSWANAMIAPPSNTCKQSVLPPVKNLDPFNCHILPTTPENFAQQCQADKVKYSDTVKPDCSRLPPNYQPFCRALQPADQTYNPKDWPNIAAASPEIFAAARQRCGNLGGPREYYTCLWSSTKYPHYPEFGAVPARNQAEPCPFTLINRDNCPCSACGTKSPFGSPVCSYGFRFHPPLQ